MFPFEVRRKTTGSGTGNKGIELEKKYNKKTKKKPHYRCLPCRGSGAYTRSNIDLVN